MAGPRTNGGPATADAEAVRTAETEDLKRDASASHNPPDDESRAPESGEKRDAYV